MIIYKVWCEWEMPIFERNNLFMTEELANKAIEKEDWSLVDMTLEEVKEDNYVQIIEVNLVTIEKEI